MKPKNTKDKENILIVTKENRLSSNEQKSG